MSTITHDIAVLIGRFQPFHRGHLALLNKALSIAPSVVVVIGSANQARTPKNPFTWRERAQMIHLAVPEADRSRIHTVPVRDHYHEGRWLQAVHEAVAQQAQAQALEHPQVALVGHFKDATSAYLRGFPNWALQTESAVLRNTKPPRASHADSDSASPHPLVADGSALRDALFGAEPEQLDAALAAMVELVPASTLAFVKSWAQLPWLASLQEEWTQLQAYRRAWSASPYPPVFVTVDAVLTCQEHVLLIQRGQSPGKGLWAVPGGFIDPRETAWQSALRELEEETRLRLLEDSMRQALREVAVFDHPDRSQRGRTITHAHYFDLGSRELPEVCAADDAAQARWVPITALPAMEDQFHDDHFHMLDHFLGLTHGHGPAA